MDLITKESSEKSVSSSLLSAVGFPRYETHLNITQNLLLVLI